MSRLYKRTSRRSKTTMLKLRETILQISERFYEEMSYGMIVCSSTSYIHAIIATKTSLPFINTSQKKTLSLYIIWVYANPELLKWFTDEFPKHSNQN
jgi:hypothetical protein